MRHRVSDCGREVRRRRAGLSAGARRARLGRSLHLEREAARSALRGALTRRQVVGTPLQRKYLDDYAGPVSVLTKTFWGQAIEVTLPQLVACEIDRYGVIEPALSALFIEVVEPAVVVYDAGAHYGYYSMLADALGGQVHAFEPSPSTRSVLARNVSGRVHLVPKGLWKAQDALQLNDYGPEHSAVNTFMDPRDESLTDASAVHGIEVMTIDDHVGETGAVPDLIKVDVEGAELQVLEGAGVTMSEHRPVITIEVGDTSTAATSRPAVEFALRLGYAAFELRDDGLHRHEVKDRYSYGNLLLVPPGAAPPRLEALE